MYYLNKNKDNQTFINKMNSNTFLEKELSYSIINDTVIIPHVGCFNSEKQFIDGTWLHETTTFSYKELYNDNSSHIKKAVYIGCLVNIWGHCITDGLKRLWFLFSNYYKDSDAIEFVYITVNELPLPDNYKKILNYIIPKNIKLKEINTYTTVDELYIPDVSFYSSIDGNKYYYKEFIDVLNLLREKYIKPTNFSIYDKIYLSRTFLKTHLEFGEEKIEKQFAKAGFTIIHPEEYTLEQQLFLYENCKYFVSLEGSGAHNSLFCKPGTNVFIIRKSNSINPYQITIDKISAVNENYIDAHFSIMNSRSKPWVGPFFVYVNENISKFFKKEFNLQVKKSFPFFTFIQYLFFSILVKIKDLLRIIYHKIIRR